MLAASYSPLASTIATTELNFRVRNENGCDPGVKPPTQKIQLLVSKGRMKFAYPAKLLSEQSGLASEFPNGIGKLVRLGLTLYSAYT